METTDNGSGAPAAETPAAAAAPEVKRGTVETETPKAEAKEAPPIPRLAPPAGTEYVYGEDGVWHIRRIHTDADIAADYDKAVRQPQPGEEQEEQPAAQEAVTLEISEHVKHSEGDVAILAEVSPLLAEAGYNRSQSQRIVDLLGEEVIAHRDAPVGFGEQSLNNGHSPDAVLVYLEQTWGSEYATRLAAAQKQFKALPKKMQNYLEETGLGNAPSVLNVLANLGEGLMGLSKEQAQTKLDALRKDPKGPYRNAGHRDHKLAVARARVLTEAVARGDDPQAFETSVRSKLTTEIERTVRNGAPAPARAAAAASGGVDPEARIKELRRSPAMREGHPDFKATREALRQEYLRLYPGTEA